MAREDIAILSYPDTTPQNVALLRAAAAKRDINLHEWIPHRISIWCANGHAEPLYENTPREPAVIVHRTIARLQALVVPALRLWAERGSVIVNDLPASVASRDKLATAMRLTEAGLPTVPSLGFLPWEWVDLDRLPADTTVIKPAHGLQGRGVSFFTSRAEAQAGARTISWGAGDGSGSAARRAQPHLIAPSPGAVPDLVSEYYLAQPAVGAPGQDIRAYVVGGACVALARRRSARPGEPRANITLGAVATALPLDHPAAALAVAATHALGLDYAGVDLLEDGDGQLQILEVDAWAGFAGLERATGADVSGRILDLALDKLRRSRP